MTVQELIFELEMIADKNKTVVVYDYGHPFAPKSDIYSTGECDDTLEIRVSF